MLEWLVANLAQLAPFMLLFAVFIIVLVACVSFVGSIVGDRKKDAYGVEDSRSQRADPVIETKEEDDFQHDPQNMSVKPTTADHAQENTTEDAYAQRDEEALYEQVAEEMAARQVKKGLWAKAFAQCEGDSDRTKALYIKLRVEALKDEAALKAQPESSLAAEVEDTGSQRIVLAKESDLPLVAQAENAERLDASTSTTSLAETAMEKGTGVWRWIGFIILFIITLRLFGIVGGLLAFGSYSWLKPKLGTWGAVVVSGILGAVVGISLSVAVRSLIRG